MKMRLLLMLLAVCILSGCLSSVTIAPADSAVERTISESSGGESDKSRFVIRYYPPGTVPQESLNEQPE